MCVSFSILHLNNRSNNKKTHITYLSILETIIMIKKTLFSFLFALVAFGFTACDSDDNNVQVQVPDSAMPSKEFKLGNCDKEKYADDAIKLNVKSWGNSSMAQEFASIELFADGHFLITTPTAAKMTKSKVGVTRAADSSTLFKKNGGKPLQTRAVDASGTIIIDNGLYIYGTYTCVKEGVYQLSNNTVIEVKDGGVTGYATVTYTNSLDISITITVTIDVTNKQDDAVRHICRSWRMDSAENWLLTGDVMIGYGKQWLDHGRVMQQTRLTQEGKDMGFDEDDLVDDKENYCYRVIFSPCGTFVCFYIDGDVEIGTWEWTDTHNGVLRCWEAFDWDDDDDDDFAGMTVRFEDKQMRIYGDFMDTEDNIPFRTLSVASFSAKY